MYVARILYPVKTLGPGDRVGIWFSGCVNRCAMCISPELWEQPERFRISAPGLMKIVSHISDQHHIDGFTLSGGEPFYQPDALRELLPALSRISQDILIYSGYLYEDLSRDYQDILAQIAVLVDGPYIEEQNHQKVLKGSDNQRVIVLKPEYQKTYDAYCRMEHSAVQNFTTATGVASVGIHKPGFQEILEQKLKKKGLIRNHGDEPR